MFFYTEKRLTHARIRVYMRIWAHSARKYAHIREINYKKFCYTLDAHAYARYNKYILD